MTAAARPSGDVVVWRARATPDVAVVLGKVLNTDEQNRAGRFQKDADRWRFIVGRGLLRTALGDHLGERPADLGLSRAAKGKPVLDHPYRREVGFNVSHAGDTVLVALRPAGAVGVDVELVDESFPWSEVVGLCFSAPELAFVHRLAEHRRAAGFFECWTRKEAWLKVGGDGLCAPLPLIDVSPGADGVGPYWVRSLDLGPDYAGAVAGEGDRPDIALRLWTVAGSA